MHKRNKERGVVLVLVLWMLALLTVMAAGYSRSTRIETLLAANNVQSAQARAIAEAGIWMSVRHLLEPAVRRPPADGALQRLEFSGENVDVRIQDEGGKIDLNAARPELLNGLLESAGVDAARALDMANCMQDWRDRDNLRRVGGAEDEEYRAAGRAYGAKDGPFNSVEELRLVLGMNGELFARIAPALTVHSHQPGINAQVAVAEALNAVPGADRAMVEGFLARRKDETSQRLSEDLGGLDRRYLAGRETGTVSITSAGQAAGSRVQIEAIVQIRRDANPPFALLSWSEGTEQVTPRLAE